MKSNNNASYHLMLIGIIMLILNMLFYGHVQYAVKLYYIIYYTALLFIVSGFVCHFYGGANFLHRFILMFLLHVSIFAFFVQFFSFTIMTQKEQLFCCIVSTAMIMLHERDNCINKTN